MATRKLILTGLLIAVLILSLAMACGGDSESDTPGATTSSTGGQTSPAPANQAASTSQDHNQPATAMGPGETVAVVTTSNIVADWVRAVGKDRVEVFPLLPPNADPHTYQPGARDIARVADADLVFSVGLSLEGRWLDELIENAARGQESMVAVGDVVDPIDFTEIFGERGKETAGDLIGRIIVGSAVSGALSAIDLEHGDVDQDFFDLGSRVGHIYSTKSGRFAIVVASDSNAAHVFDGAIYFEGTVDHFHRVEAPLERLDIDLSGERPTNLVAGGEWAVIFYEGSGDVVLLNEHELREEGDNYVPRRINVGPHLGAAVPLEDDLFAVTMQHPDYDSDPGKYAQPVGAKIVNLSGEALYHHEGCEELLGWAGNGYMAAFGCIGGALVIGSEDGNYEGSFIPAPGGAPGEIRFTSVWGHPRLDHFFAQGRETGLYLIKSKEGSMEQLIPASGNLVPISVAISHDGETLLVAMSGGELRMYDAHDLDLLASASGFLTAQAERGFWASPDIITAPGAIFITDVAGRVLQLDGHDLEVVDQWDIAGNPAKLAFVGIFVETGGHEEHGHGAKDGASHGHGELDPHFWFDPLRVQQAVNSIASQLSTVDPAGRTFYRENAAAYGRELDSLHDWITVQVGTLPEERRVLVTSHDSFQYFARRYGFKVAGAIFPVTTESEPTAQDLASLIDTIEREGVPAVFTERSHSERLAQRVAEETGATLIGGLYTGSLGEPGGEAGTYLELMRHNTTTIVEALR